MCCHVSMPCDLGLACRVPFMKVSKHSVGKMHVSLFYPSVLTTLNEFCYRDRESSICWRALSCGWLTLYSTCHFLHHNCVSYGRSLKVKVYQGHDNLLGWGREVMGKRRAHILTVVFIRRSRV